MQPHLNGLSMSTCVVAVCVTINCVAIGNSGFRSVFFAASLVAMHDSCSVTLRFCIPHVALPHSVLLEAMQVLLLLLAKGVRPPLEVISAQTLQLRVN